jgi:Skp family chaperone for outer membrane proteins
MMPDISIWKTGTIGFYLMANGCQTLIDERRDKMKRYSCLLAVMVVFLVFPISAVGVDANKFGVVDLQRCITESLQGKRIFETLKKKKDEMQVKLDKQQEDLRGLKDELDKQSMMLSMDARQTTGGLEGP